MKKELIIGLSLTLASTVTFAESPSFEEFDLDSDGLISQDELYRGLEDRGSFARIDADSDGIIDEAEIADVGIDASSWDINGTDIGESEFNSGIFDRLDANQDGEISEEEFSAHGDF